MAELPRDIVLLVDDSPEALGFLTDALEQSGFSVLIATSGSAALSIVERITPDLILLDAVMEVGAEGIGELTVSGTGVLTAQNIHGSI